MIGVLWALLTSPYPPCQLMVFVLGLMTTSGTKCHLDKEISTVNILNSQVPAHSHVQGESFAGLLSQFPQTHRLPLHQQLGLTLIFPLTQIFSCSLSVWADTCCKSRTALRASLFQGHGYLTDTVADRRPPCTLSGGALPFPNHVPQTNPPMLLSQRSVETIVCKW